MELFSNPFAEYQSSFHQFGGDDMTSESSFGDPDTFFPQFNDAGAQCLFIPQDDSFSISDVSFSTETNSPVLSSSATGSESLNSESPASTSPLSSPGGSPAQQPQQQLEQISSLESMVELNNVVPTVPVVPMAPVQKKQRRVPSPKQAPVQRGTAGKKRKAPSAQDEKAELEYLKQFNSAQIEEMRRQHWDDGTYDPEEDRILKFGLRKAKNRESAKLSRVRQKEGASFNKALAEHNRMVADYWHKYATELKDILEHHGIEAPPEPEIPAFVPPPPTAETSRTLVRPLRTAGICLMFVLLSVGIFYNLIHTSSSTSSTSTSNNGGGASSEGQLVSTSTSGGAKARVIVEPPASENSSNGGQPLAPDANSQIASIDMMRKSAYLSCETDKPDSSLALVVSDQKQQIQDQVSSSSSATTTTSNSAYDMVPLADHLTPETAKAILGGNEPHIADRSWSIDNSSSYIFVNEASEFVPHTNGSRRVRTETDNVKFWFSPSSFVSSKTDSDGIFEVTCDVRNVTFVPRSVLDGSL